MNKIGIRRNKPGKDQKEKKTGNPQIKKATKETAKENTKKNERERTDER